MAEKMSSEDATRESLIAISYTLPDNCDQYHSSPDSSEKNNVCNNTVVNRNGSSGDFRSELISLSYTSPDAELLPDVKG